MKKIVILPMLLLSLSAFAAEDCVPIHKSKPISFAVSAKKGLSTMYSAEQISRGNELSPIQPSDKLLYSDNSPIPEHALSFALIPVSSCKKGVLVDFEGLENNKQQLIPWSKTVVVEGNKDSDYFIEVTANKVK